MVNGTVLGRDVAPLRFKAESGEDITGSRLWIGFEEQNFLGLLPAKFFIRPEANIPVQQLEVGAIYAFDFDRKGHLVGVASVTKKGAGA